MFQPDQIKERILKSLPGADVDVRDMTGTGNHFEARIVSSTFSNQPMIQQHQSVYASVDDWLKSGELHALALRTFTPEQWTRFLTPKPQGGP